MALDGFYRALRGFLTSRLDVAEPVAVLTIAPVGAPPGSQPTAVAVTAEQLDDLTKQLAGGR